VNGEESGELRTLNIAGAVSVDNSERPGGSCPAQKLRAGCVAERHRSAAQQAVGSQVPKLIGVEALANHIGKVLEDRSQSQDCPFLAHF